MAAKGDINKFKIQPELKPEWNIIDFENALEKTSIAYKLKSTDYNSEGVYPVIDQSSKLISGYIDDSALLYKGELPVVVFGDHTRNIKFIDFEFGVGADGTKVLKPKKNINSKFFYYYIKCLQVPDFGYSRHYSIFKILDFPVPPLAEQERIVAKLDALFARLEKIKDRIEFLKILNNRFFESIFYQNNVLGKLFGKISERTDRVGANWQNHKKIGVSAKEGIIDLFVGDKTSFDNYKVVYPGDFIYNTMRINIGSIAIYQGEDIAITSPDYVVFKSDSLSKYLLLNYLKSEAGLKNISAVTKGSVRSRLYFKSLITIPFPELTEQQHNLAETFLHTFNNNIVKLNSLKDTFFKELQNSILHKAFKGELVEQLPTDGDAKDLLKEILALKDLKSKKK